MPQRAVTNWDNYCHNDPANFFVRKFFLDAMFSAYRELLERAIFKTPISILELGAGTGYSSLRISERIPTRKITLIDNNPNMLDISKKTLRSANCEKAFINRNLFDLALEEKFDLVHSAGLVEHFEGEAQERVFRLHAQLTKPGGYCIIYAPTPTSSYKFLRKFAEVSGLWRYPDETPLTKEELVHWLRQSGLEVIKVNYFWRYGWLSEIGGLAQKPRST